ncbi:LuxR C-terminal-related transcriptional regulator [Micromonospora sp. NPDC049366]|uniref:response regulator transcription factor n=1 Tax=Micromonospora sp. NPDC049366 TaxID=3364271 RepID=UPI0037B85E1F
MLSGRDTSRLDLPPDALAWLAQQPTAPRERYAPGTLLRLAVRTVRLLVDSGPAVLVVEDLHALDPASLNLIGELATAADLPALLVVATRPAAESVAPDLAVRVLSRLCGVRGAVRQHLGPLRPDDVAEVLTQVYANSSPSTRLVTAVWRRTGGNPYALTELLAAHSGQPPEALLRPVHVAPLPRPGLAGVSGPGLAGVPGSGASRPAAVGAAASRSAAARPASVAEAELTAREVEILDCLVAGMSNKQAAKALGISVRTVTVHVSNLLRKTGSASRTEVALWAVRHAAPAQVDG